MARYKLPDHHIDDIIVKYKAGATTVTIGAEYRILASSVSRILRRNNVITRPSGRRKTELPISQVNDIVDKYNDSTSPADIGLEYGLNRNIIIRILHDNGISTPVGRRRIILSGFEVSGIINMYNNGVSLAKIGIEYGVGATTISRTLSRNNVIGRSKVDHG